MIIEGRENNGRSEGGICEMFVYPPNLVLYPSSSYMNELSEMPAVALRRDEM